MFKGIRGLSKDDGNSGNIKNAGDIDSSESGITGGDGGDRTGPSSGASTPGDKEGEKLGTKRVTRSKGQGEYIVTSWIIKSELYNKIKLIKWLH